MGILSFLGFEDEKEEQQSTAPVATNSVQAPAANSGQNAAMNSTMMKMNGPSNLSGGRRRRGHKSKKHHKGKRATKRRLASRSAKRN